MFSLVVCPDLQRGRGRGRGSRPNLVPLHRRLRDRIGQRIKHFERILLFPRFLRFSLRAVHHSASGWFLSRLESARGLFLSTSFQPEHLTAGGSTPKAAACSHAIHLSDISSAAGRSWSEIIISGACAPPRSSATYAHTSIAVLLPISAAIGSRRSVEWRGRRNLAQWCRGGAFLTGRSGIDPPALQGCDIIVQ